MNQQEIAAPKDDNLQAHNSEVVNSRFMGEDDEPQSQSEPENDIELPQGNPSQQGGKPKQEDNAG